MNNQEFKMFLEDREVIISDGATGTNLIARGLPRGITAEQWLLEQPDKIQYLHEDFINSGSNIILTSTFGGSRIRLKHAKFDNQFEKINQLGVRVAKNAVNGTSSLVAGSIGPLGEMLKPLGLIDPEEAIIQYKDQARILADNGVDLLVIETQFDISEAIAAIEGVRMGAGDIALICSFSFDRGTKTMMGVSPSTFFDAVKDYNLSAIGINCGKSIADNEKCLSELSNISDIPIWFKPNAGLPQIDENGEASYSLTPSEMGEYAKAWPSMGAKIIGGCCGTTPAHLANIAEFVI
jgi:5-methyltetrahydrofolate--homocysteine methyltransferase